MAGSFQTMSERPRCLKWWASLLVFLLIPALLKVPFGTQSKSDTVWKHSEPLLIWQGSVSSGGAPSNTLFTVALLLPSIYSPLQCRMAMRLPHPVCPASIQNTVWKQLGGWRRWYIVRHLQGKRIVRNRQQEVEKTGFCQINLINFWMVCTISGWREYKRYNVFGFQ